MIGVVAGTITALRRRITWLSRASSSSSTCRLDRCRRSAGEVTRTGPVYRQRPADSHVGAGRVVALEFKPAAAPSADDALHLFWLRDQLGADFLGGAVIHSGPGLFELGDRVYAVPLCAVWS